MEYPKFKVCCRCFTFNHSKYITDTMNGFTMQQTSFPFVCCIVDDASTDGEQEVIRKYVEDNFDFSEGSVAFHKETDYAHITYAQHKSNKNCYFVVLYLKYNHYSQRKDKMQYLSERVDSCEYEALCEGDDYWTDCNKLNKQVKILDDNSSYSMCFHNAIIRNDYNNSSKQFTSLEERIYSPEECIYKWLVPTASIVYRMKYSNFIEELKIVRSKIIYGDNLLVLAMLHYGQVYALSESMSVYRKHIGGAVYSITETQHDMFYKQLLHCKKIFKEYSNLLKHPLSDTCFNRALKAIKRLDIFKFIVCLSASFYYSPRSCYQSIINLLMTRLYIYRRNYK